MQPHRAAGWPVARRRRGLAGFVALAAMLVLLAGCLAENDRDGVIIDVGSDPDTWSTTIQPLFSTCTSCHGATPQDDNGLILTSDAHPGIVDQVSALNGSLFIIDRTDITSGVKENSTLYLVTSGDPAAPDTPFATMTLSAGNAALVGAWIDAGAP